MYPLPCLGDPLPSCCQDGLLTAARERAFPGREAPHRWPIAPGGEPGREGRTGRGLYGSLLIPPRTDWIRNRQFRPASSLVIVSSMLRMMPFRMPTNMLTSSRWLIPRRVEMITGKNGFDDRYSVLGNGGPECGDKLYHFLPAPHRFKLQVNDKEACIQDLQRKCR